MAQKPTIIENRYVLLEVLGRGGFAIVYKCMDNQTNELYAAKVFHKNKMTRRGLIDLDNEARICRKLDHPNVVRLHHVINEDKIHVFIFDYITGGELFDDLVTRGSSYTEELAAKCMFQLLATIKYCHKMGVVHRDLKPENILLESKETRVIKLADFGLAKEVKGDEMSCVGLAGTHNYMAPEVYELKPYGKPVDCWACGVIMYVLLSGRLPFYHHDERVLEQLIKSGDYDLQSRAWRHITSEGKNLVSKLLCVVPTLRISASDALLHPWFVKIKSSKQPFPHCTDNFEAFKDFNARRKIKAAVHSTLFVSRVQNILTAKRREKHSPASTLTSRSKGI